MQNLTLYGFLILILFSCSKKSEKEIMKERIENDKDARRTINEIENRETIKKIISTYNIESKWDTIKFDYTIDYKKILKQKYQLIEKYKIIDIYEKKWKYIYFNWNWLVK